MIREDVRFWQEVARIGPDEVAHWALAYVGSDPVRRAAFLVYMRNGREDELGDAVHEWRMSQQ